MLNSFTVENDGQLFTLIIIDDEDVVRRGLAQYVDWRNLGFKVKASFEDGESALAFLKTTKVDVVLTDIRLMELSGLDLAEFIAAEHPSTKVVIMSGHKDFDYAVRALRCDVFEYFLKPVELDTLKKTFSKLSSVLVEDRKLRQVREAIPNEEQFLQALIAARPQCQESFETLIARIQETDNNAAAIDYADLIVKKAKVYLEENYARDISLEQIAQHVFLSPSYFSRFYKERTGKNFTEALAEIRVRASLELLDRHECSIAETGARVGYPNAKYFTRVFKHLVGITPSEYIRRP